jgi:hypothetical protein
MKQLKRLIGSIIATLGVLAAAFSAYQLFTTGNLQWLTLVLLGLGFVVAGSILIIGNMKDFIEALLDIFQIVP